jgi:hypothetical protein
MEAIKELQTGFGRQFERALIDEIDEVGIYKEVLAGTVLIDIGEYVRSIPLLLSGALKILREDDEGDELLLYYLEPGDTCSMTLICCIGDTRSEIRAIAQVRLGAACRLRSGARAHAHVPHGHEEHPRRDPVRQNARICGFLNIGVKLWTH